MTAYHSLIDYCKCLKCYYDLPQHEAYFKDNNWFCYKCYIKYLEDL